MTYVFANNATSRLKIDTPAGSATLTLLAGEGEKFPAPVDPEFCMITIDDRRTGQLEICKCIGRSGDFLQVLRGQEGTTALDFLAWATVSNRPTAATFQYFLDLAQNVNSYTRSESDARYINVDGDIMTAPLQGVAPTAPEDLTRRDFVDAQIATRAPTVHTHTIAQVTDLQSELDEKLESAPSDNADYVQKNGAWLPFNWAELDGKPTTFPPDAHTHPTSEVIGLEGALASLTTQLGTKEPAIAIGNPSYFWAGDKTWKPVPPAGINEAPTDGQQYARRGSDASWQVTGGGITDGDKGDIVVSSAGSTWLFDSSVVTAAAKTVLDDANVTAMRTTLGAEAVITAGTTAQYWRGDKTWVTLDKTAVGLANVDNTSDANKPVSTAGVAADDLRVLKGGDTMTGSLRLPAGNVTTAALNYVSEANTGIYFASSTIHFAASGGPRLSISNGAITAATAMLFRNGDGSNSTPAYSFASDTNTGMYRIATDQIGFATNATQRLLIADAAVTTTVPVVLPADPTTALQAATKQYVDAKPGVVSSDTPPATPVDNLLWYETDSGGMYLRVNDGTSTQWVQVNSTPVPQPLTFLQFPAGITFDYWGATAPAGSLFAYGQAVSRTTYAALFAILGTTHNTGGEAGTDFRLPDLRGRVTAGKDNMGGTAATRLQTAWGVDGLTLGAIGGSQSQTLTNPHLPGSISATAGTAAAQSGGSFTVLLSGLTGSGALMNTGGSQPHTIVQPTIICNVVMTTGGV